MDRTTVLFVEIVAFLLLSAGIVMTILEFRKMGKNPDEYTAPRGFRKKEQEHHEDAVK